MENEQQEAAAEQAALKVAKEEDIRAEVIKEYGFNETEDAERIEKLTKKELENQKRLSSAIGQKIKHRTEAQKLKTGSGNGEGSSSQQPKKEEALTTQDTIALAKADVDDDDMDEVLSHAKFKGISVREALKSPYIKSYLSEQKEFRTTAAAANAGGSNRAVKTTTPETLMKDLSSGKVPEKGSKEAEELFWAKRGGKR